MRDFWNAQFQNKMPCHGPVSALELYGECVGVLNISLLCHFERTAIEILEWNNSRAAYFTDLKSLRNQSPFQSSSVRDMCNHRTVKFENIVSNLITVPWL